MATLKSFSKLSLKSSMSERIWQTFCPSCVGIISGSRYYKGSNRDIKRREWNKKMEDTRKKGARKFDFKKFMYLNYEKEFKAFVHRFSLDPDNPLLWEAFIHQTSQCDDNSIEHNGKLAVLGFNITSQIIISYLFFSYPNLPSHGLRSLQEHLLQQKTLADVAQSLSIHELIKTEIDFNSDETISSQHGFSREDIIADSFLALIAAIHLHEGETQSSSFVRDFLISQLYGKELESVVKFKNPELSLTSLLQEQQREKPVARLMYSSYRYTEMPVYVVGIFSSDSMLAQVASPILEKAKYEAFCSALTNVLLSKIPEPQQSYHSI
ncbi:39S ribosomal protein L44, mitochondrial-like [Xenia sp. Carnegie-2017]|uniref:39S ribosomal protein L44, mitochondrial-like n=1 Tax=Xenia sp. Carnegie-2017 TaxID=2897299 RepID=UPI001F0456A8|nr:39S ribosomal protein L44, mitochondrial-like [Xenia sp. Carnegie-2017]